MSCLARPSCVEPLITAATEYPVWGSHQGAQLEELWQVKDGLAREAGYDIHRIFADLRAAEARHPGTLLRTADELRCHVVDQEHRREATPALALKEEPPSRPPDRKD